MVFEVHCQLPIVLEAGLSGPATNVLGPIEAHCQPCLHSYHKQCANQWLAVRLIPKGLKIVFCLFVGYEENQAQELAVNAARGRHALRQKSHMLVPAICIAIIADLVGFRN